MKIWEAIQMLQEMDQNKEVTVTFGTKNTRNPFDGFPKYDTVHPRFVPDTGTWPMQPVVTCKNNATWGGTVH